MSIALDIIVIGSIIIGATSAITALVNVCYLSVEQWVLGLIHERIMEERKFKKSVKAKSISKKSK